MSSTASTVAGMMSALSINDNIESEFKSNVNMPNGYWVQSENLILARQLKELLIKKNLKTFQEMRLSDFYG